MQDGCWQSVGYTLNKKETHVYWLETNSLKPQYKKMCVKDAKVQLWL